MVERIQVTEEVYVPADAIEARAVRSSGPGGQNVNKVASKVELHVDLTRVRGLTDAARLRLERLVGKRTDASGRFLVTSQRSRDRPSNLKDAREKVRELLTRSLVAPTERRPTKPKKAARERRLDEKRQTGLQKKARGRPWTEE
jgi:ribosome-associated protein